MAVNETRANQSRTISATAELPAELRMVLECNPMLRSVRMGHALLMNADLMLDIQLVKTDVTRTGSKNVDLGLSLSRLSRSSSRSRRVVVDSETIEGTAIVSTRGDGLFALVNLQPNLINDGFFVPFEHGAELVFRFDIADQPLITRATTKFRVPKICARGREC